MSYIADIQRLDNKKGRAIADPAFKFWKFDYFISNCSF